MGEKRRKKTVCPTNLNEPIEALLKNNYNYSDIGELFTRALMRKKSDSLAYYELLTHKTNKTRSSTIRRVKLYFLEVQTKGSTNIEGPVSIINKVRKDSLLGTINDILETQDPDAFEEIGRAVYEGTKNYLRIERSAETKHVKQFKEYCTILNQLNTYLNSIREK